jgi:tetratricopeptide (TPR) repeat protein
VTDLLSFWGKHHPIALVQVLPERLWSGSALRAASAIQMQSPGPDVANERLTYSFQSPMDRLLLRRRPPAQQVSRLPVPILTLDGDQVADWASLVTGTGTTPTSGFLLTSTPDASPPRPDEDEQAADNLSPEHLVDEFREYASPEAFRLAQFLAAAPLSLPVIRLVQRTMMPKARQGHIAEVFLSGLLRRRTPAEAAVHPEYVWYDFLAGVREVLRQGLSLYEDALVMERVTEYVREHYGTPQDFQALLFDPDAVDGVALDPHLMPFAEVVAGLQERVGVSTKRSPIYTDKQTETPVTEVAIEPIVIELENERIVIDIENEQVIIDPPSSTPTRDALHQLRAPVTDFVNRKPEIQTILAATADAVRGGGTSIIGLRGMGGIGKTELALRVANLICDIFPDAQLVVQLFGATSPVSPERALQSVIRAFEPTAKLPDDLSSLTQLYQACLHGKRALILADDARDAAQVRPLLPPAGCAMLITSRTSFNLPGMRRFDLGMLTQADAENLLLDIAPRISAHAPALAQLCGYLPLALRVSAGILANDNTRSVSRYLEQLQSDRLRYLRDPDKPDDPAANVEASLQLSYDALPTEAQQVFANLSVFTSSFDLAAAESVILDTQSTISDTLNLLVRRSLVDYDNATMHYSLNELVRAFALSQLQDPKPSRKRTYQLRHARYYQQVASHAEFELYLAGKQLEGLALFDRERQQIDGSWQWVMQQPLAEDTDLLLIDFAKATVYLGDLRYDTRRERISQLEMHLQAARRQSRRQDEGNSMINLGVAYSKIGDYQRAIEYHEQGLAIARELGDRRAEGTALDNLGRVYTYLGEYQRAIDYHEQGLAIARELGDLRNEGSALGNLGFAYANLGDYQQAVELYKRALEIMRMIGDRTGEAHTAWDLARHYKEQGQLKEAKLLVQIAAEFFLSVDHREYVDMTRKELVLIEQKLLPEE